MATTSCPKCGQSGIAFELNDAEPILTCPRCNVRFTAFGGAIVESAIDDSSTDPSESAQPNDISAANSSNIDVSDETYTVLERVRQRNIFAALIFGAILVGC